MLTDRDIKCIKHVEKFGWISIGNATDMFYSDKKFGYDMARRRLNKLVQTNYLKVIRNQDTNEKLFVLDNSNIKKVPLHSVLLTNYYSKLVNAGAEVLYLEKEKTWTAQAIRSDAFIHFKFGGYEYFQIVEINVSHNDVRKQIGEYEKLYDSKEAQKICVGMSTVDLKEEFAFPYLIVIDNVQHKKPLELPRINVVQLNYDFDEFSKIFI